MKNLVYTVPFLVLLFSAQLFAQAPDYAWVNGAGSTALDIGEGIAVDLLGNTYVVGQFSGTVNFSPTVSITSSENVDYFLAKFSASGEPVWAIRAGGGLTERGYGVALDNKGYVYTTGHYFATTNFHGTPLTSAGNLDNFVAKYDTSGNLIWIRDGKSVSQVSSKSLAVDLDGNVYVSGYFGSATVDSLNFDGVKITTNGQRDIFLAKYNNDGQIQWAVSAGGALSDEEARSTAVDHLGNVIITGRFVDTANFSGTQLISNGSGDIFVAKYNSIGNLLWVVNAGGPKADRGESVDVDALGNIYVVGFFDSIATFGSVQFEDSTKKEEAFIAKYDPDGNLIWLRSGGGPSADVANGLKVMPNGCCFITGRFNETAAFGSEEITSAGANDIFFANVDADGNLIWVKRAGSTDNDYGNAITVDVVGNSYATGYYRLNANFDLITLTGFGAQDIFIAKIGDIIVPVELTSFKAEVTNGNVILTWVTATEINNSGFEIERSIDNNQFEKIGFIEGQGTTSEYHSYSFIDKSISNGTFYYRLKQIDYDGTTSYSKVLEVEVGVPARFEVMQNYPNPFNPETQIAFNLPVASEVKVTVYNLLGQIVSNLVNQKYDAGRHKINFNASELTSGTYFYSVEAKGINGIINNSVHKMILIK